MFGKYFKYVLVLTMLAGTVYSLPQVKDAMVGAFGFDMSEEAMVLNFNSTSSSRMASGSVDMFRPPVRPQVIMQAPSRMIPPEEVIAILFKVGVISKEKLPLALKVIKEHASITRQISPFNSSTTPPFSSTTRPTMRESLRVEAI